MYNAHKVQILYMLYTDNKNISYCSELNRFQFGLQFLVESHRGQC